MPPPGTIRPTAAAPTAFLARRRPCRSDARLLGDSLAAVITNSGTGAVHVLERTTRFTPCSRLSQSRRPLSSTVGTLATLLALLDRHRTVLVLLLRLSGYAIGVFEGERLVQSKVGSRFVKARHKKGGSSSGRFARRREGQARALMDKASETFQQQAEDLRRLLRPSAARRRQNDAHGLPEALSVPWIGWRAYACRAS